VVRVCFIRFGLDRHAASPFPRPASFIGLILALSLFQPRWVGFFVVNVDYPQTACASPLLCSPDQQPSRRTTPFRPDVYSTRRCFPPPTPDTPFSSRLYLGSSYFGRPNITPALRILSLFRPELIRLVFLYGSMTRSEENSMTRADRASPLSANPPQLDAFSRDTPRIIENRDLSLFFF